MLGRRSILASGAALLAAPFLGGRAFAAEPGRPLPIPPLADASGGPVSLDAIAGAADILEGVATRAMGYSQPYLGPTLRLRRGEEGRIAVRNRLDEPITAHWHGTHVPSDREGGPHQPIPPGDVWDVTLPIDQPAATLWYHSHIHGRTAEQVYFGLAGLAIVDDPGADMSDLPGTYGVDDLPLIVQDRMFDDGGQLFYLKRGPVLTHGFHGDTILVNGGVRPMAQVPRSLVRLRILNACNARIFGFYFADRRRFWQVAGDAGLLASPVPLQDLRLAPAERAEILVDFSDGVEAVLLSAPDRNRPLSGGMMRGMAQSMRMFPPQSELGEYGHFEVMRFAPGGQPGVGVTSLPAALPGAPAMPEWEPVRTRSFELDVHGPASGTGPGTRTGDTLHQQPFMSINGVPYDPARNDFGAQRGEAELWRITVRGPMDHPFHVHGTSFRVLSLNGAPVDYSSTGMKDVVLIDKQAEILIRFDHEAPEAIPYMYHCHILEHEDSGMMGQFTVS